ncbi:hypothetical protein [Pseudoalteromonas piscicida]|uniref:hypothetical protein n=1 Tax=Pseudoalteromonas piscicida TaxID=43662 RepID=UPI001C954AE0|nr:hypothetical protein [Pseudoalteromonas piscicida]QZO15017.1 hypothetical protein K5642_22365 [Pseudoalteromonas piscicida]
MNFKFATLPLSVSIISGCANFSHYNEDYSLTEKQAILMDAKQRGVYGYKIQKAQNIYNGFCAEPNPDAVSAMAATLGLDLTLTDKGKLGLSNAMSEGVSNIGLRTTAIQALRDIMYRNCEAYAGGGITTFGLETLQRRFQSTMVAIIAIEQLTGAVKVPNTMIVSETEAGSPEAILELTNKTEQARIAQKNAEEAEEKAIKKENDLKSELDSASQALTALNEELKTLEGKDPRDESKIAEKKAEIDAATSTMTEKNSALEDASKNVKLATEKKDDAKDAFDALDNSRIAALTGGGKASNQAVVTTSKEPNVLTEASVSKISDAVVKIVDSTNGISHTNEVCTTIIGQHTTEKPEKGSPLAMCLALLASGGDKAKSQQVFDNALNNFTDIVDNPAVVPWLNEVISQNITIKDLQKAINELGYQDNKGKKLEVDGYFGDKTETAIELIYLQCKSVVTDIPPFIHSDRVKDIFTFIEKSKNLGCKLADK